jgi:subfamily B ATP-binding cassette protein MsbA
MDAPAPYSSTAIIRRLLKEHIKPYVRTLWFAIFCMVVIAVTVSANTWMMQPALDKIFIERDRDMLTLIPLAIFGISLVGASAHYGNALSMRYIGQRLVADMQIRLFDHLMKSDIGLFHDHSSGRLLSRFTNDIALMRNAFSNVLTGMAKDSLSIVFLISVMVYQNAELALIALSVFPIAFYPLILLGKKMRRFSDKVQNQLGDFTATLDEIFQGVRTVKSYNREEFESNRARTIIEKLFRLYHQSSRVQAAATPMMEILGTTSIALVIWYGGSQVMEGEITPGAFFSFIAAFLMAYKPVRSIAGTNTMLQEGITAAGRFFSALDMEPSITDKPGAVALVAANGEISLKNVRFAYPQGGRGVHGVDIDIPAGKKVALVGLSGGGKSTIMNLLMRFYEIQGGQILVDGQDIRDVTLSSLRRAMAYVPQESMLFDDTVGANIAYGRQGATQEEIEMAAINAAADEFIRSLPHGYDTMIGAQGVRLSGGQRQRISIARAMLKNAPILLLDEATSSLDNESERMIQQALDTLMQGRTSLVIAHRLSTIVGADIIYVIEGGKAIECGTHAELIAAQGAYYRLYSEHLHEIT